MNDLHNPLPSTRQTLTGIALVALIVFASGYLAAWLAGVV